MATKFYLIISTTIFFAGISASNAAPMQLSGDQMDTVTAGGMTITATADASVSGVTAGTQTLTNTSIKSPGKNHAGVLIGRGVAQADACCGGNATATAITSGTADGRIVVSRQINNEQMTPYSASATSSIFMVSVSPPGHH